jgi:CMP-N-acetylneuraminic acid synthetase
LDRVIVSTDDEEIAKVAESLGAEAPFIRPPELSTDEASSVDVASHALETLEASGYTPDYLVLLQPTSPLRTSTDVAGICHEVKERDADAMVSVTEASAHPWIVRSMDVEGRLQPFVEASKKAQRRQDLPTVYAPNGALYVTRPRILKEEGWYGGRCFGFIMPEERSLDVDTEWDLLLGSLILKDRLRDGS